MSSEIPTCKICEWTRTSPGGLEKAVFPNASKVLRWSQNPMRREMEKKVFPEYVLSTLYTTLCFICNMTLKREFSCLLYRLWKPRLKDMRQFCPEIPARAPHPSLPLRFTLITSNCSGHCNVSRSETECMFHLLHILNSIDIKYFK